MGDVKGGQQQWSFLNLTPWFTTPTRMDKNSSHASSTLRALSHEYDIILYSKPYMGLVFEGNFPASSKTTS